MTVYSTNTRINVLYMFRTSDPYSHESVQVSQFSNPHQLPFTVMIINNNKNGHVKP